MPDPALYLQAMIVAAVASALYVLATGWHRPAGDSARVNLVCVLGVGLGMLLGYRVLQIRIAWPPINGLDRLLTIILPIAIGIELIAGTSRVSRRQGWLLRLGLAAAMGRILLHGSVYLGYSQNAWTTTQAGLVLVASAALMAGVWWLLVELSQRHGGASIPLALSAGIQCAGITIMLAGYVTGGAAAIPLVAAVVGTTLTSSVVAPGRSTPGVIGIAVVGLFGLLFVGRFFGGLSTERALIMLGAPLLCWVTEIPVLRNRTPWQVGAMRLALVLIPLAAVLALAMRDFNRDTRPLLSHVTRSTTSVDPISVGRTLG